MTDYQPDTFTWVPTAEIQRRRSLAFRYVVFGSPSGWSLERNVGDFDARKDYEATLHARACGIEIPESFMDITVKETVIDFGNPIISREHDEHKMNVKGVSCNCGKFTDVTISRDGSFAEMEAEIIAMVSGKTEFSY